MVRLDKLKDLLHCSRNDSTLLIIVTVLESLHCVGLACACLTIRQNRRVVPMEHAQHCRSCCLLVNRYLAVLLSIDTVKTELMVGNELLVVYEVILSSLLSAFLPEVFLEGK